MPLASKVQHRLKRKRRVRAKVAGTAERPRLTVYRSLNHMTVQLVDDATGKTLAAANTKALKAKADTAGATKLGAEIAKKAKAAKIETVVFDRNGYDFHGRVKALAEAAREGGLKF